MKLLQEQVAYWLYPRKRNRFCFKLTIFPKTSLILQCFKFKFLTLCYLKFDRHFQVILSRGLKLVSVLKRKT